MDKDFTHWHAVKQQLNQQPPRTFEEREVWWASVGANVGFEQDGKHEEFARPVLVIRKFSRELFLGVPLSTQLKTHPYYQRITFKGREQAALLMQVRAWSSRRLINPKGKPAPPEFERVREALRAML